MSAPDETTNIEPDIARRARLRRRAALLGAIVAFGLVAVYVAMNANSLKRIPAFLEKVSVRRERLDAAAGARQQVWQKRVGATQGPLKTNEAVHQDLVLILSLTLGGALLLAGIGYFVLRSRTAGGARSEGVTTSTATASPHSTD